MIKYKPLTSVLVKPSGPDCNLGCTYCFYLNKSKLFPETKIHRMSPKIQEEMIRQLMQQSGDSISIGWQGGEPSLMGLDFYKRAIELEQKYGHVLLIIKKNIIALSRNSRQKNKLQPVFGNRQFVLISWVSDWDYPCP